MVKVQSCNNSDDDCVRRIPSLLRGNVKECNFERYSYCIIVVLPLEDIHIVFVHVKNPKRMNVTPLVKMNHKNLEETIDYLMFPLRSRPKKLEKSSP